MAECAFYDVGCHATWLSGELDAFFSRVTNAVLDFCASAVALIPLPDALLQPISFTGIPNNAVYLMNLFNISTGIGIVVSAYFVRFIIRRIPFFG